jgi:hypothetical protein
LKLEAYIENRSRLFNQDSQFSCPDWCNRFGCKDEKLHVSVSIIDLVAASLLTGEKASHLFRSHYRIGGSPVEENPWIHRFALELKKPCPFEALSLLEGEGLWYIWGKAHYLRPLSRGIFSLPGT